MVIPVSRDDAQLSALLPCVALPLVPPSPPPCCSIISIFRVRIWTGIDVYECVCVGVSSVYKCQMAFTDTDNVVSSVSPSFIFKVLMQHEGIYIICIMIHKILMPEHTEDMFNWCTSRYETAPVLIWQLFSNYSPYYLFTQMLFALVLVRSGSFTLFLHPSKKIPPSRIDIFFFFAMFSHCYCCNIGYFFLYHCNAVYSWIPSGAPSWKM